MRLLVARLSLLGAAALAGGGMLLGFSGACSHDWDVYLPPEGVGGNNPGGSHPGGSNPGGEGGVLLVGDCPPNTGNTGPAPQLVRVPTPVAVGGGSAGVRAECIGETEVTRAQYELWLDAGPIPSEDELPTPCQSHPDAAPSSDWPPGGVRLDAPVAFVDWCDAMMFCLAHGQRLCGAIGGGATPWGDYASAAVSEWFNACTDRGRHPFPYGDTMDLALCRDNDAGTVDVKAMSGCVTSTGVYDLSGNVWEWEDSCMSGALDAGCRHRGGGYNNYSANDLGCAASASTARDKGSVVIGFRCCADPTMP